MELKASEIARWLSAVAGGQVVVQGSRRPVSDGDVVLMGDGWAVSVLLDGEARPKMTDWAVASGGRSWMLGCERNWLELGPPVEPLEMLPAAVRQQLMRVFMAMPAPDPLPEAVWWPDHEAVAMRQAQAMNRKRRKTAARKG